MKNNLAPYLSWLLKERPFAAPTRGDGPTTTTLLPPIKSTSTAAPGFCNLPEGKQATFTESFPVHQDSFKPPYNQRNKSVDSRDEGSSGAYKAQFGQGEEDMARLRIEPTPKRPKLSSAVQTPRGTNPSAASEAPVITPAVKLSNKRNVANPYGSYIYSESRYRVRSSDRNIQIPQLSLAAHLQLLNLSREHQESFLKMLLPLTSLRMAQIPSMICLGVPGNSNRKVGCHPVLSRKIPWREKRPHREQFYRGLWEAG